jgi:S1-C subfamily serine protease
MVLTPSGEVLTNNHVVDGATSITVTLVTTGRTYSARVVGTDPTDDLAVVQLQGASGLKTISVGDSSGVQPGESVVGIGNAGGVGGSPSVVTGTVQAVDQTITASNDNGAGAEQLSGLLQTDLPLQPGDSGGPLANSDGQVIGMDTAASAGYRFQSAASTAFAIPIDKALSIVRQIESGHATSTVHIGSSGVLGIEVQSSGAGQGALVAGVAAGSPAESAGLTRGDVIVSVGGQTVDSAQALTSLVGGHRPGDRITVGWTDGGGQAHRATVVLATGPAD